jgi:hypothetical protein
METAQTGFTGYFLVSTMDSYLRSYSIASSGNSGALGTTGPVVLAKTSPVLELIRKSSARRPVECGSRTDYRFCDRQEPRGLRLYPTSHVQAFLLPYSSNRQLRVRMYRNGHFLAFIAISRLAPDRSLTERACRWILRPVPGHSVKWLTSRREAARWCAAPP